MQTLSNGVVIPEGSDSISGSGVDEMRALGVSVNSALDSIPEPWGRAPLGASTSLDGLERGEYIRIGSFSTAQGYPFSGSGTVNVSTPYNTGPNGFQSAHVITADETRQFTRRKVSGSWGSWYTLGYAQGLLPVGADLNLATAPGAHQVTASRPALNSPPGWSGTSFTLEVLPMGTSWLMQRATNADGAQVTRFRRGASENSWDETWTSTGGAASRGIGLQARMAVESTGQWTTVTEFRDYLTRLAEHPDIELLDIGETVNGASIPAIRIGDPDKPAFLALGGQHGNEPVNPHGLGVWARQVVQGHSTYHMDMCILIVPMLNIDQWQIRRQNANGIDLNRDWIDYTQPETQAVQDLIAAHNVIATVDGHSFGYPRQVSTRATEHGTPEVIAQAQLMHDAVQNAVIADGNFAREYEPVGAPETHKEAMGAAGIPSIVLEVPSDSGNGVEKPNHGWQVRMAALAVDAAAREVWKWTPTYPADLVP